MGSEKKIGLIRAERIWGNMNLGAGHSLAAPAGIIGAFNTTGNVYFVHGFTGLDTNTGTDPANPWQTITHAISQCVADNDDYIIVLDCWQEAMPIVVNVPRVHILGLSSNPGRPFPCLNAALDTAIFEIDPAGDNCEIAGFCLGGGAAHGAIERTGGGTYGVYIHHNIFGSIHSENTPLAGIIGINDFVMSRFSHNKFLGDGGGVGGVITGNGIVFNTGPCTNCEIVDNVFMGLDIAMNIAGAVVGMLIKDNVVAINANTAGGAVTLGAATLGCFVVGNVANFGDTAMAANPYTDNAGAGANTWVDNRGGGVAAGTPWLLPA